MFFLIRRCNYNPIDTVENLFSAQSYELDRRDENEVVVEVQGKWNNMLLFFAWEENMHCLHLSCLMDIKSTIEDRSKIFEMLTHKNRRLKLSGRHLQMHQSHLVKPTEEHKAGKFSLTMPRHHSTVWSVN